MSRKRFVLFGVALAQAGCLTISVSGTGDGGTDAGLDAGRDAGLDAGQDAGLDAGFDAGPVCGHPAVFAGHVLMPIPGPVPPGGWNQWDFASADFNQDGIDDFALAAYSAGGTQIYYGLPDGGFSLGQSVAGSSDTGLLATDLNGDGWPDLVGANGASGIDVMINQSDGTFVSYFLSAGAPTYDVSAADLDGDGRPDIVSSTFIGVEIFFDDGGQANGFPGFQAPVLVSTQDSSSVRAVRMSANGPASLVYDTWDGMVFVQLGIGDGGFLPPVTYSIPGAGYSGTIVVADFNLDGLMDVAVGADDGVAVYLNADGGVFAAPILTAVDPSTPVDELAVADLNGDGFPDLLGTGGSGVCDELAIAGRAPVVFLNDCSGGFPLGGSLDAGLAHPYAVGVVTLLGGGLPSVLVGDLCGNDFEIIPNETSSHP